MLIGLIADTHIPRDARVLPPHVKAAFKGIDLILHAGDIYVPEVLDELEKTAPVLAARGNGDWPFPEDHRLRNSHVLDIDGFRLGLTHIIIYPELPQYPFERTIKREFDGPVDIAIFGDTHVALVDSYKGVLLVNPGSPTVPNSLSKLGTVGLLEITEGKVKARIIQLSQFCIECARPLQAGPVCPQCEHTNAQGSKFCEQRAGNLAESRG